MIFNELKKHANERYPALLMDHVSSRYARKRIRTVLMLLLIVFFGMIILEPTIGNQFLTDLKFEFRALFFISFILWLLFYLYEAMYLSYYFRDGIVSFEVSKLAHNTPIDDVTFGFLNSSVGKQTMIRLGISASEVEVFLKNRSTLVAVNEYSIILDEENSYITLSEYGRALLHYDIEFKSFLRDRGITAEIFKGSLGWIAYNERFYNEQDRWWSKDRLARIPSLGKNWSFGKVFLLEKYGHSIFNEQSYRNLGDVWKVYQKDVNMLEQILVKEVGSNAMLIAEDHATGMEIVSSLAREIVKGRVVPELESKRIFILDGASLVDRNGEKTAFENEFNNLLIQASNAGNVILVIPNVASLIENAQSINSDIADILNSALSSSRIQIITLSDTKGFHETVETDKDLMRHFEKVVVKGVSEEGTVNLLKIEANYIESKNRIFFTYQSLLAVALSAKRYFSEGILSHKSINLIHEVTSTITSRNKKELAVVRAEDVLRLIEVKTGIPQGKIKEEERNVLNNLEEHLHKRIIGQNLAITSISRSLKRARAGLNNPDRPIGSFLFMGPTGVGKTETTKALAEIYFESEENIMRIDMSEYTDAEALQKLIGSFQTEKVGRLSSILRENKYGVLLLDEFEKTTSEVMDLFLQIIDEGEFTDGRGEKINARNIIIIATSNAGSDKIYEATKEGQDVSLHSKEIIDSVIQDGIFKPELINRFDSVIVFHALTRDHLVKIAELMVYKLNRRLEKKGIVIKITPDLIDYLVNIGNDPKFGARQINRAIQDTIEQMIADAIIDGKVKGGDTISFQKDSQNKDLRLIYS